MSNKPVVTLDLTQEEVDALYLISWNISGHDSGYRGVFTGTGRIERGLIGCLKQYTSEGLSRKDYISGEIRFADTRYYGR